MVVIDRRNEAAHEERTGAEVRAASESVALAEAWRALGIASESLSQADISGLINTNSNRYAEFIRRGGDLCVDFAKAAVDEEALRALFALARACQFEANREALFCGELVNVSEERAALHMALRAPSDTPSRSPAEASVGDVLDAMRSFTRDVHLGGRRSVAGACFTDVVHIGIGGSSLGPALVVDALAQRDAPMRVHFLDNIDPHGWERLKRGLDPAHTLVLIASKSFRTVETMANARLVQAWLVAALGQDARSHLVAMCGDSKAARTFGVDDHQIFPVADWVGGRFSLWSAIGLSIMLSCGVEIFDALLAGARTMDEHFRAAPVEENLPLLLALLSVWHTVAHGMRATALLPYDQRLALLPAWAQQLEMESLGKRVTQSGAPVRGICGSVVFGMAGTTAQHSIMQFLHQGGNPVLAHFLIVAQPDHDHEAEHRILIANALAQSEALLRGRNAGDVRADMTAKGYDEATIERQLPHRVTPGNRPSITTLVPRLDASTLGQLLCLFEHKVFCEAVLWGVNPFDQWGVELGKLLAAELMPALEGDGLAARTHDAATQGLIAEIRRTWAANPNAC